MQITKRTNVQEVFDVFKTLTSVSEVKAFVQNITYQTMALEPEAAAKYTDEQNLHATVGQLTATINQKVLRWFFTPDRDMEAGKALDKLSTLLQEAYPEMFRPLDETNLDTATGVEGFFSKMGLAASATKGAIH